MTAAARHKNALTWINKARIGNGAAIGAVDRHIVSSGTIVAGRNAPQAVAASDGIVRWRPDNPSGEAADVMMAIANAL